MLPSVASDQLVSLRRDADGDPAGLLVLFHGRGVDERDLFPLADLFDPDRRLVVVTPRAPLTPPGHTGNHWYVVERVGFPDRESFAASFETTSAWVDELAADVGVDFDRVLLGGFSQGAVMSFALGLGSGRPRPAGIMALSGFIPTVEGWQPDLASRQGLPIYLSHGRRDPVISVEFARQARQTLEGTGVELTYRETEAAHNIDPRTLEEARDWIAGVFERGADA
jgi:phospholipase/carboxylesterase